MNTDNTCGQGAQIPLMQLYFSYPFIPLSPYYMMPAMFNQPTGFSAYSENTAFKNTVQASQNQLITENAEPGQAMLCFKQENLYSPEPQNADQPMDEIASFHPKTKKVHRCDICKKVLSRPSALKLHMNSHSSVKLYSCPVCLNRFSYEYNLKIHMISHEEKSYKCEVCVKRFSEKEQLEMHSKIHSNCVKIECKFCKKRFKRMSSLTVHLRIHSGDKPFKCSECRKAFISSGNLKVHLRVHVISI